MAISSKVKPSPHPRIEAFLRNPLAVCDWDDLSAYWKTTRVTFVFRRPDGLEGGIRLPGAIRGALGDPLREIAEAEDAHPLGSLFHAMYADHCQFADRWHVPKPFVIWTEEVKERVYVQVSLFGEAGVFKVQLINAMLAVMSPRWSGERAGVSIMPGHRLRRPWELLDLFWQVEDGFNAPPPPPGFSLYSRTPIVSMNVPSVKMDMSWLFLTMLRRITGLLRWHGLEYSQEMRTQTLEHLSTRIRCDLPFPPKLESIHRRSRTFAQNPRRHYGAKFQIKINDYPEQLWPAFLVGTRTHLGFEVSQGFGRMEIFGRT